MICGKVWGTTELVTANPLFEYHRIVINAGGYCSEHSHKAKWNGFYLESGRLVIRTWNPDGSTDQTILEPGQYTQVGPGVCHQFEALADCVAYELYWALYAGEDIERRSVGGMRGESTSAAA